MDGLQQINGPLAFLLHVYPNEGRAHEQTGLG
jgi:hypothetical protein